MPPFARRAEMRFENTERKTNARQIVMIVCVVLALFWFFVFFCFGFV